jgi:RNA-binding protein
MEDSTPLSSAEKKELRGIGQRLKPHVHIGKQGLTLTVSNEIETALIKNGLIKVRFEADRETIKTYCAEIAKTRSCEDVGGVGKTRIFFRDMPEEEKV